MVLVSGESESWDIIITLGMEIMNGVMELWIYGVMERMYMVTKDNHMHVDVHGDQG